MTLTARKISNISIIIPTLNEQENLQRTISSIQKSSDLEILVVDGGSTDKTVEIAKTCGAQVLFSEPGRAAQMIKGAAESNAEILLFLHADTILPLDFREQVSKTLTPPGTAAGAFKLAIDHPGLAIRIIETAANLRSKILQLPYGDQAIFLKRTLYNEVGGFPDIPILEEIALMRKLHKRGSIRIAESSVLTSGRRWQKKGIIKNTLVNQAIILGYLFGVSPQRLQNWYRVRKKA